MNMKHQKNHFKKRHNLRRGLAAGLILCLLLTNLNFGSMLAFATEKEPDIIKIGSDITAKLEDGILTIEGYGDTDDFTEDTAPFLEYAQDIHALVIEDGITYVGAYLFYGLGGLHGELTLPGSIAGFGDYAFSGESSETAPGFSRIRNEFVDGEITRGDWNGHGSATPSDAAQNTPGTATPSNTAHKATPSEARSNSRTEKEKHAQDDADEDELEDMDVDLINDLRTEDGDFIEYITEQQIEHPDTLFYEGQTGIVVCSEDNESFMDAAESAGYETAEGIAVITMDGIADAELPVRSGKIKLPECPEEIESPFEDDEFFTNKFAGWTVSDEDAAALWESGDHMAAEDGESLLLYSAWEKVSKYQFRVKANRTDETATYTLFEETANGMPEAPDRYTFLYQWQIADKSAVSHSGEVRVSGNRHIASASDAEEILTATASNAETATPSSAQSATPNSPTDWHNIDGANTPVYVRAVEPGDNGKQFRCMITVASMMRARTAGGDVVIYSDGVTAAVEPKTIYVADNAGNDTNSGTRENPVKTLAKAVEMLNIDGDVNSNQIVLLEDYQIVIDKADSAGASAEKMTADQSFLNNKTPASFTISGIVKEDGKYPVFSGRPNKVSSDGKTTIIETDLFPAGDIAFENIEMKYNWHIYGQGHNITFGDNVTCNAVYLYGSGKDKLVTTNGQLGTLSVASGHFARIVGYVRSVSAPLDAQNKTSTIKVSGSAVVDSIIAGNASGGVIDADVRIIVDGPDSKVPNIVGGCQGFNDNPSAYIGSTEITVRRGTVTNIYGAGTGRNISIPTYKGALKIAVSGGSVTNIYGSGSAAYIVSDADQNQISTVDIDISGGSVDNIYAAGKGGETGVRDKYNNIDLDKGKAALCGSLSGKVNITVRDNATVKKSIYASGEGYIIPSNAVQPVDIQLEGSKKNAYLDGEANIRIQGGTVKGDIYGGGKGIDKDGYDDCARVTKDSKVSIELSQGGVVEGNIYGGGERAKVGGSTQVTIIGGTVKGTVYGGGKLSRVEGNSNVLITGGTIEGSVYGGAFGVEKQVYVYGGSTVNMTGGWIRGNLYGGSQLSNTGRESNLAPEEQAANASGLVFVNLVGGKVSGKVFGGGYKGIVNGSTHLHIGKGAISKCQHYSSELYKEEMPENLSPLADLVVDGSVYAGGDYGDGSTYDSITVKGFSHVYIDGTGYRFRNNGTSINLMQLSGGVFGSGASCDAGDIRLVTLDHYGEPVMGTDGAVTGAVSSLTSIQRADQVRLINSHVRLAGQSDIANENKTTLYSLNRIGDGDYESDKLQKLGSLGNGLILKGGSTLVLDSASIEVANLKSVDASDAEVKQSEKELGTENYIIFSSGTMFHVSHTVSKSESFGAVSGYFYIGVDDAAEAYIYARIDPTPSSPTDGGFDLYGETDDSGNLKELDFTVVNRSDGGYRYWKTSGKDSRVIRHTVLTAQTLTEDPPIDGYAVAKGVIELPPAGAGSVYTIKSITLPESITLVDAAKMQDDTWAYPSNITDDASKEAQRNAIKTDPLKTFGLFMYPGNGFSEVTQKKHMVISPNTIPYIKGESSDTVTDASGTTPEIEFYLTYYSEGITASQELGKVVVTAERSINGEPQDTITMEADIVTKASNLSNQEIDLYATQNGSYTGRWIIPAGADRTLSLTKVETGVGMELVKADSSLTGHQAAVTMQPVKTEGWQSKDLMAEAYDIKAFASGPPVSLGSTDSRYEAPVEFTLYNAAGFDAKTTPDEVKLTFNAEAGTETKPVIITLSIHWEDSIIGKINVASGKHYNDTAAETNVSISQESSVTAGFEVTRASNANDLWLALQTKDGKPASLPVGTELTLLDASPDGFYSYVVTGTEEEDKIPLTKFKKMWSETLFTGTIDSQTTLTFILAFDHLNGLTTGDYSLRLQSNAVADPNGADFTINNSSATVQLEGGGGFQEEKSEYPLTLTISPGSDSRLTYGAAAVITLDDHAAFPEGTIFTYEGRNYTPVNDRVYLVLGRENDTTMNYSIIMDTTKSTGLAPGTHSLTANIFSVGLNSGSAVINNHGTVTYEVTAIPKYGLKVALDSSGSRAVTPNTTIDFTVSYSIQNTDKDDIVIGVRAYRKSDGTYSSTPETGWLVNGNTPLMGNQEGAQNILVTVPDASPGTYRLEFTLGDKKTFYNIILKPPVSDRTAGTT